jgi:chromosome segregation ATPase
MAAILIGGALTAAPSSAATKISNGVACSKSGATTKVGGYSYKCAKNTLVKNSKLTWLSVECLSAIAKYSTAVKDFSSVGNVATKAAELDTQLAAANASLTKVTTALENAKAQLKSSQDILNKTTNATEKTTLSAAIQKLANAVILLSTSKGKLALQVTDLANKKAQIAAAPDALKTAVSDTKEQASLLCAKGF